MNNVSLDKAKKIMESLERDTTRIRQRDEYCLKAAQIHILLSFAENFDSLSKAIAEYLKQRMT